MKQSIEKHLSIEVSETAEINSISLGLEVFGEANPMARAKPRCFLVKL